MAQSLSSLPENPCTVVTLADDGASERLGVSRQAGLLWLNTPGTTGPTTQRLHAGLAAAGVQLVAVEASRWQLASEDDARRAVRWLMADWPRVHALELNLAATGLPGPCAFRFELKRGSDGGEELRLTPELEFHRDEQRALVPQAEAWLAQLLLAPVYEATPEWVAQWRVTREGMNRLLLGPMDPFLGGAA